MSDAPQVHTKKESAFRVLSVSFLYVLENNSPTELLTGTPAVTTGSSPELLTIDNVSINTTTLTINGVSHIAGKAIQFRVSGGTGGTSYDISITCGTDSTPAQTLGPKKVTLIVESD